jgi:hypothetical protein
MTKKDLCETQCLLRETQCKSCYSKSTKKLRGSLRKKGKIEYEFI